MKISVVGCGYLGAVHAASMAQLGHDVVGIDVDLPKVEALQLGKAPFYEPGFDDLLTASLASGRLVVQRRLRRRRPTRRSTSSASGRRRSAASTPRTCATSRPRSSRCCPCCGPGTLVVGKSTVPVGTAARLAELVATKVPGAILAWNPEFLREGFAVEDTLHPDRLVYGLPEGDDADDGARPARRGLRADRGRRDAEGGHRLRDRRDGEDRGQLVPRHEDLVHQRDGRAVRGDRRGRQAARRRDRLRRPDRPEVPQRRPRVRRRLSAEGHPGVHGAGRRAGGGPGADVPARGRQHQHAAPDPDGGAGPGGLRRQPARQADRRSGCGVQAEQRRHPRLAGAERGRAAAAAGRDRAGRPTRRPSRTAGGCGRSSTTPTRRRTRRSGRMRCCC